MWLIRRKDSKWKIENIYWTNGCPIADWLDLHSHYVISVVGLEEDDCRIILNYDVMLLGSLASIAIATFEPIISALFGRIRMMLAMSQFTQTFYWRIALRRVGTVAALLNLLWCSLQLNTHRSNRAAHNVLPFLRDVYLRTLFFPYIKSSLFARYFRYFVCALLWQRHHYLDDKRNVFIFGLVSLHSVVRADW